MSKYGPDYRLLWPVTLFQEEARRIAEIEDVLDRSEQAHWLVSDAFAGTGPIRDVNATLQHNVFEPETYQATRKLLRKLADDAPSFPNEPRQYWRQRRQPEVLPQQLSLVDLQSAWLDIVKTMDADGYLDAAEQSPCADGASEDERNDKLGRRLSEQVGLSVSWPLEGPPGGWPAEDFFTLVEVLHDLIERPVRRWYHDFDQSMHALSFAARPGRVLYRWRVNQALDRSAVHLRLAEEGLDEGLLVHASRDGRDNLVARVVERAESPSSDPVVRAVMQFRDRNADRLQKRSACILLAHELEQVRARVKERLLTKDEGMLFQIANQFAIRHQKADQHSDYDDAYLDWVFWTYLATIELMHTLAGRTE